MHSVGTVHSVFSLRPRPMGFISYQSALHGLQFLANSKRVLATI